jgi:hypothetical protein
MKQHEVKSEKQIGDYVFYIRPFPAFLAANLSGDLASAISPAVAAIVPLAAVWNGDSSVMNIDVSSFSGALAGLSGDKVESLLRKLLTKHNNISARYAGDDEDEKPFDGVKPLDNDLANEVFCGSAQDMFILAAEVINANFGGFFEKLGAQFGLRRSTADMKQIPGNTGA